VLEYYAGILFLTTNRVGAFDEAFTSRIHISLYYPPLDEESTVEIWKMNLKRTRDRKKSKDPEKKDTFKIKKSEILAFARQHFQHNKAGRWNGRQIRNAFQTAIALAEFEARGATDEDNEGTVTTLREKHFSTVAKASLDFDQYLEEVFGGSSASKLAFEANARADYWGAPTAPNALSTRFDDRGTIFTPNTYQSRFYEHGQGAFSTPNQFNSRSQFDHRGASPSRPSAFDPKRTRRDDDGSPKPATKPSKSSGSKRKPVEKQDSSSSESDD